MRRAHCPSTFQTWVCSFHCPKELHHKSQPQKTFTEAIKICLETILLKRTIIQQIIVFVDTKYFAAFFNPVTGKITPLVPVIFNFLCKIYGKIPPQNLDDKTAVTKLMIYNTSQPINIIFKNSTIWLITQLQMIFNLRKSKQSTLTSTSSTNSAYQNTIFECKCTTQAYKTWDHFKHDFHADHLQIG